MEILASDHKSFYQFNFEKAFLTLILLEVLIGGSGRFTELNPSLTLRILLYIIAIIYSIIKFNFAKIHKNYIFLLIAYMSLIAFHSFLGLLNGAEVNNVFEDIKYGSYFLMLPFFSMTIRTLKDIIHVTNLIKFSSLVLLFSLFAVHVGLTIGIFSFGDLYEQLSQSDQFFFRGEFGGFFYKGFTTICIAVFFFYLDSKAYLKLFTPLMFLGVILTYTRGFLISTSLITFTHFTFFSTQRLKLLRFLIVISLISFFLLQYSTIFLEAIGSKEESDSLRILLFSQVFEDVDISSFFIGHGLGIGVPVRPIHMETSYLEIFHKQGLIGLLFWLILFILPFLSYARIHKFRKTYKKNIEYLLAQSFLMTSIFLFVQSFTNPFINNSIGMSIYLISLISIDTLSSPSRDYLSKPI